MPANDPLTLAPCHLYVEWRYWLLGFGWRTDLQDILSYRGTLFLGPLRLSFWRFDV